MASVLVFMGSLCGACCRALGISSMSTTGQGDVVQAKQRASLLLDDAGVQW